MSDTNKVYLKLGPNASLFADPITGINLANNQAISITDKQKQDSKRIMDAIGQGHLVEIKEAEYKTLTGQEAADVAAALKASKAKPKAAPAPSKESEADADDEEDEDEDESEETEEEEDLEDMTKSELLEKMKDLGIPEAQLKEYRKITNTAELVKIIKQKQAK